MTEPPQNPAWGPAQGYGNRGTEARTQASGAGFLNGNPVSGIVCDVLPTPIPGNLDACARGHSGRDMGGQR